MRKMSFRELELVEEGACALAAAPVAGLANEAVVAEAITPDCFRVFDESQCGQTRGRLLDGGFPSLRSRPQA